MRDIRKRIGGRQSWVPNITLSILLGLSSTPLLASEVEASTQEDEATIEETITVTASRDEKDTFDEPAVVELVTLEDLTTRLKVTNFVDALQEIQGVSVQKTAQGQGSPFIRGFTGFRNLLLIDGIRFNNSVLRSGPNQYWATIDPLASSRIELAKGPGSMLYGSDAVGGTVNVLSANPSMTEGDGPALRGKLYYRWASAEDSNVARLEATSVGSEKLGLKVGASWKDYGDFEAGGDTGTVTNSAYDELGLDLKMLYLPRLGHELAVVFQSFEQNQVPRTEKTIFSKPFHGTRPGNELRRDQDQNRSLAYLKYSVVRDERAISEAIFTLSYQGMEEERIRVRSDSRSDVSGLEVGTFGIQAQLRSEIGWGRFTYGLDLYHDSVDSYRTDFNADGSVRKVRIQGSVADDASYYTAGVFLQDEISIADDHFAVILGARMSHQALDAARVESPETGEVISIEDDWTSAVGSARLLWRPDAHGANNWHLFTSLAQAFRAPNLSDITSFDATSAIETPTPGLEPEHYLTFEVGLKRRTDRSSLVASYYYTDIEDQIVQSPTGRFIDETPEVQKSNVGDGYVQGFELAGSLWMTPSVELWGNLSYTEGEVDQFLFDEHGQATEVRAPVSRIVPWMSHWGVRYAPPRAKWWAEFHGTAYSKADKLALRDITDTRRIPPGGTPGFVAIHLRGAVELLDDSLTLSGGLENLLDEDYRVHGSGQNMPGRNLVLSLSWSF